MEKGNQLYKKMEDMDSIFITQETFSKIFEGQDVDCLRLNFTPVFKKGVFCSQLENVKDYILFECESDNDGMIYVKCESFQEKENIFLWSYSCHFSFNTEGDDIHISVDNYMDAFSVIYKKQNFLQKEHQYIAENISLRTQNFLTMLKTMAWINYLSEYPEEKAVTRKKRQYPVASNKNLRLKEKNTIFKTSHVINLNGICIITDNQKTSDSLIRKTQKRIVACWNVRGHYRHYKNGKTVYIHPYQKGLDKSRVITKTYKL